MERQTYYMILGVSSTESDRGIRAAYRHLAKKFHPDVAGEQATRSFQEISEAYSVLSDPQRRREYNDKLNRTEDGGGIVRVHRAPPEPLVRPPVTIFGNRDGIPKSERLESLTFEVLLTAEEASRGCVVPVDVAVFRRCPQCGGSGHDGVFPCAYCQQQGIIETEERLHVRIQPLVPSGSIYEIPLRGLGIHTYYLGLHVFVEAQPR